MSIKFPVGALVVFSIWIGLFTPFIFAQNTNSQIQSGFQFRISEAARENAVIQNPATAPVENLTESEANAIFKRLPPMRVDAQDNADFKVRSDSLKPPRTGKITPIKFPADETNDAPNLPKENVKPLAVERFSPTGNVSIVSDVSVTFSQPMIAVSSQSQASETVPVKLSPQAKGKWRWLGTNTLVFDAETRLPMATKFTATILKNTRSAVGGILAKDFSWTFTTPPPKVEIFVPKIDDREVFPEHAIMAAKFNQEVDGNQILAKIKVFADGKQLPIKLITDEVDANYTAYQQLGEVKPKHWMAFRTIDLLPLNTEIKVVFEKGVPSAEGVGISETEQIFTFKTLGDFKLSAFYCGYSQPNPVKCQPSDDFRLQFNRSLYPAKLDPSLWKIEPPIENVRIEADGSYSSISIRGAKKPNTTYKVTLSGEAIDFYKLKIKNDISAVFNVGAENPKFFAQGGNFVTLDPNAKPSFSVYSKNHPSLKIKLYAVTPEDYQSFSQLLYEDRNNGRLVPTPKFGKLIFDKTIETDSQIDVLTETRIDLGEALPDKFGHAILIAEPTLKSEDNNYQYYNQPLITWIQSTNIGVDTLIDYEKMTAFATDLQTGKPLANVAVSLISYETTVLTSVTDKNGIVEFSQPELEREVRLVLKNDADSAIVTTNVDWRNYRKNDSIRWFVFDDRKMYRPNEEVSIKGYVRKVTGGKFTDIAEFVDERRSVNYLLKDSRHNEIARGTIQLNAFGAFDFKLKLPENINLGNQRLEFRSEGFTNDPEFKHTFQVHEFRRPEFEVTVTNETPMPFFVGDSAVISAEAKYYTGGFLSNAAINWSVFAFQTTYSPPNHEEFSFGTFVSWWRNYSGDSARSYNYNQIPAQYLDGISDASGKHRINLSFMSANPARPYTLRAVADTRDVNRQTVADTKNFLVHPSDVYVGLRTSKTFVRQNETFAVEAIAADLDGKIVTNAPITIDAVLKDWQRTGSGWQQITIDTQTCRINSSDTKISCNFAAKQGGVFIITATVLDTKERPNTSEIQVWVAGGNTAPNRDVEQETVELIPDKKEYSPNDTAEVLVNAPFFPAEGVMSLERNGIIKTTRFTMNENSTTLQIPIEERYLPNFHVKVDLVGVANRTNDSGEIDKNLPKRPAFASGELNLNVSKTSRKLIVAVKPIEETIAPGAQTNINIEVKDYLGNAVANSEVALVAVDESVLALTDYKIQNPLDEFYKQIAANVAHYHSREKVLLENSDKLNEKQIENLPVNSRRTLALLQMDGSLSNSFYKNKSVKSELKGAYKKWIDDDVAYIITETEKSEISVRRNFNALAIFSPSVITDENGKATVDLKLPDNLTRYRITAVAVTKSKQFGLGESSVTAKQSLQIRPSAPRFMNFGDRAELPVVLQNQTDSPMTVNVAIRAGNAILTNGNGRKVTVAANNRAEIRFPINSENAGIARFQIGATGGNFADAAEIEFPVYTPASVETFATYGTTEANGAVVQTVFAPKDVYPQFGGLEVTTSSTQLQELTDAFIYLQSYPFECTEQISSRILSVAALRDVLTAFDAKDLPSKEEIAARMKSDIARLQGLQHADGGFSFWRSDDESLPFVSVHVAHAIARAKAKDYDVSNQIVAKSLNYLKNVEAKYPKDYSEESRRAISAYALYVRDLLGDKDITKAKTLLTEIGLDKLSAESIGWLLSVLANDKNSGTEVELIKQNLLNRVTETAGNAHFVTNYKDGEYVLLSSKRRADGVILEALLKSRESGIESRELENLIPKIVRGLLAARIKGRWQSTQENAFVLLALDKYFQIYEKATPDFVARIWLGNAFAGEQKFAGRSADSNLINVPMNYLQTQNPKQNLILDKQGEGRLYYRIGLKYAPKNLKIDSADNGFAVSRQYEAMDNESDVKQNSDGVWTIKSGARVRVNVQMIAPTRRYHVALVDNLPAGFEIINPESAISGNNYLNYSDELRRRSFWFQHQNLRDNRAEVFTMLLSEGVWNYSYSARATTPGNFVAPPAKAEEMYAPETFGRSKTDFVRVE